MSKMIIEIDHAETEIDWSVPQLVIDSVGKIVQVSSFQDNSIGDEWFCGQDLKDGWYNSTWIKENFTKFTGKITLKND